MKKLLTIAALIGATSWSFGQGQVTFANTGTTLISTNSASVGGSIGTTTPNLGGFVFALFAANSTVTSVTGVTDPNWTFTGAYATNSGAASGGRLAGGQPTLPSPYASGTTYNMLIRGWSTTVAGQDWTSVQSFIHTLELGGQGQMGQFYGSSLIATIAVGGGVNPIPAIFGATPGTFFQGFALNQVPVPEPSTFALAGLGAAALLIFRRRK